MPTRPAPLENEASPLTFLDLFSGCGGFSVGLESAGLRCLAAIDFNDAAIATFKRNHPTVPHALVRDLTSFAPEELDGLIEGQVVDIIVGGPPCQGFSRARQVDGANHGERLVHDPRRDLYQDFLRYVKYYQPKVFVMENVPGLRTAAGGEFFTRVQAESRELGYRVIPYLVEAWRFGVPQKRIRQFFIGTRRESPLFIPERYIKRTHVGIGEPVSQDLAKYVTLWEAIGDLPPIEAGDEAFVREYDSSRLAQHIAIYGSGYTQDVLKIDKAKSLTAHAARPHSARDLRDFLRLREGENSKQAIARGEMMEFPYDRENFKDRYTRQHRHGLCSTIVAHLQKDGLMFIHPSQQRSLTPREAARVQSFPDTFSLPESRTKAFAQIGNAVPPLIGKSIGEAIITFLNESDDGGRRARKFLGRLPSCRDDAIAELEEFVESLYLIPITNICKEKFLKAWLAIGFLHPNLHPDAAADNGTTLTKGPKRGISFVLEPFYIRSGWPVELIPVATEARRRFDTNLLDEDEYYCSAAMVAGAICHSL